MIFSLNKKSFQTLSLITQQQWAVSRWPADSQTIRLSDLSIFCLWNQQLPFHSDLKPHHALLHPVGQPAAWPQQREAIPEARLPAAPIRTHFKMEVTIICGNNKNTYNISALWTWHLHKCLFCFVPEHVKLTWIKPECVVNVLLSNVILLYSLWRFGSRW